MEPAVWRTVFKKPVEAASFLAHGFKRCAREGEVALAHERNSDRGSTATISFLVAVAIVGLVLVPVLVLQPNVVKVQTPLQRVLVGAAYSVICVLGILAVFFPAKCKSMFPTSQNPQVRTNKPCVSVQIRGHHPDCKNYGGNRIMIGEQMICAACAGLLVGAITALVGASLYFFVDINFYGARVWLLVLGELLMLLGLAQIKFAGYVKVVTNALFVVGSLLTLVETDLVGRSLLVDFYALGLVSFMLWFRILLSEWNNRRICQSCFQ